MLSINRVVLGGNLACSPSPKAVSEGESMVVLRVAVNHGNPRSDGDSASGVVYVNVDVWGRLAEACIKYLDKGSPVLVEGRLHLRQWQDRDSGKPRSQLQVCANTVHFLDSRERHSGPADTDTNSRQAVSDRPISRPPVPEREQAGRQQDRHPAKRQAVPAVVS